MALTKEDLQAFQAVLQEELKEVRAGLAVVEREVNYMKTSQQLLAVSQEKLDRGQAVIQSDVLSVKAQIGNLEKSEENLRHAVARIEYEWFPKFQIPPVQSSLRGL